MTMYIIQKLIKNEIGLKSYSILKLVEENFFFKSKSSRAGSWKKEDIGLLFLIKMKASLEFLCVPEQYTLKFYGNSYQGKTFYSLQVPL